MKFILPTLQYKFDALEPFIDKQTMEIHYTKHHQTYINNANNILETLPQLAHLSVDELIQKLDQVPLDKQTILRNNAGGHANHSLFWKCLKQGTTLQGKLKTIIERDFGDINKFKKTFESTAMTCFGSGWTWLVKKDKILSIVSTANQDNPLMGNVFTNTSGFPILGLDVWEHAYYLKYQNRRCDYIESFWNVVNWDEVAIRFDLV
ncbi:Fe-Mn family superoxide dismutase [Candidatus Palibaumannia cicadellinicola]|uniref:Superoxide dismutase n=1 Tax=Candidatus Palibaumannia cicadellinicola TaxID=186490 RepID=A0A088NBA4_9GAMM|nr:Fe-Mn family superoxide dismutase [Candidatus Baumannia cicadellinicola]AIN47403.1 Manganese superoxide dismutase [Candidatus Baumannia cicadellinicola]